MDYIKLPVARTLFLPAGMPPIVSIKDISAEANINDSSYDRRKTLWKGTINISLNYITNGGTETRQAAVSTPFAEEVPPGWRKIPLQSLTFGMGDIEHTLISGSAFELQAVLYVKHDLPIDSPAQCPCLQNEEAVENEESAENKNTNNNINEESAAQRAKYILHGEVKDNSIDINDIWPLRPSYQLSEEDLQKICPPEKEDNEEDEETAGESKSSCDVGWDNDNDDKCAKYTPGELMSDLARKGNAASNTSFIADAAEQKTKKAADFLSFSFDEILKKQGKKSMLSSVGNPKMSVDSVEAMSKEPFNPNVAMESGNKIKMPRPSLGKGMPVNPNVSPESVGKGKAPSAGESTSSNKMPKSSTGGVVEVVPLEPVNPNVSPESVGKGKTPSAGESTSSNKMPKSSTSGVVEVVPLEPVNPNVSPESVGKGKNPSAGESTSSNKMPKSSTSGVVEVVPLEPVNPNVSPESVGKNKVESAETGKSKVESTETGKSKVESTETGKSKVESAETGKTKSESTKGSSEKVMPLDIIDQSECEEEEEWDESCSESSAAPTSPKISYSTFPDRPVSSASIIAKKTVKGETEKVNQSRPASSVKPMKDSSDIAASGDKADSKDSDNNHYCMHFVLGTKKTASIPKEKPQSSVNMEENVDDYNNVFQE